MKKFLRITALILCFVSVLTFAACMGSTKPTPEPETPGEEIDNKDDEVEKGYTSILSDKKFKQGFIVRGLGAPIYGDDIEFFGEAYDPMVYFDYGKKGLKPTWRLCQWATRYPFHDKENTSYEYKNGLKTFNYKFMDKGNGVYRYDNQSKTIEFNTKTGEYSLALKASECYKEVRVAGQEWPHLLLEQPITPSSGVFEAAKISDSASIRVKIDVKLNSFKDNMGDEADPSLHSAMCLFYLFVANYEPTTRAFTDMLWFGIPIFDNRYVFSPEMSFPDSGSKGSATEKWIFNISSDNFFSPENNLYDEEGKMIFGEWKTVDVELVSLIRRAFEEAQNAGYMANSSWENLYVNGMYTGYELPGNYDIGMSFKNIDIITEKIK